MSELAVRCRVSKSAITQRVLRAETAGLVRSRRVRSVSIDKVEDLAPAVGRDQRAVWIELAPQGKELVETTIESLLDHEDFLIDKLGDEEIANLSSILRRLLHLLEQR